MVYNIVLIHIIIGIILIVISDNSCVISIEWSDWQPWLWLDCH